MKLTAKEIKEQKALYGSEAVNFFVLFFDMKERLKTLPEYFIKEVIKDLFPTKIKKTFNWFAI